MEQKARAAAELKAKHEAEEKAKAEEEARREKEIRIKAEAEARVRVEAEQKEKAEAQARAEKKAAEEVEKKRLEKERKREEQRTNPTYKAYGSLILGIVSWPALVTIFIPMVTSIWGTVWGIQALKSTKKKTAIAGLVLNGLMIVLYIWAIISGVRSTI